MKLKIFKRDTQLIALSVVVLTLVTMSVSYSAFFTVQSLSTIQELSTGDLNVSVTVDTSNSLLGTTEELFPSTIDDEVEDGNYATLTIVNNGNLNAEFSAAIQYDYDKLREVLGDATLTDTELREQLVSFSYLHIGIFDETANDWVNFSGDESVINNYPVISGFTASSDNEYSYPVLRGNVDAVLTGSEDNDKSYKVYIWLADDTPTSEIGKYVYLKLNIKAAAGEETITEEINIG